MTCLLLAPPASYDCHLRVSFGEQLTQRALGMAVAGGCIGGDDAAAARARGRRPGQDRRRRHASLLSSAGAQHASVILYQEQHGSCGNCRLSSWHQYAEGMVCS